MDHQKKLILFVINPSSGQQKKTAPQEAIQLFYQDKPGFEPLFLELGNRRADDKKLQTYISEGKLYGIVAVGGDGTVKMVADHLAHTGIPLGILPAGSANGMAKDLGLPADWNAALEVITTGHTQRIDAISINGREISIHLSDIGLNALLVKHFERSGMRGKLGYARVVMKTLYSRQLIHVEIDNGAEVINREAFMIVLANARMYGTGARINPDGDLSDGVFEVVLVKKLSLTELLKMLFRHRPFNPKKTEIIRARKVNIATKRKMEFQIDGEYMGKVNTVQAEVLPGALTLFMPEEQHG